MPEFMVRLLRSLHFARPTVQGLLMSGHFNAQDLSKPRNNIHMRPPNTQLAKTFNLARRHRGFSCGLRDVKSLASAPACHMSRAIPTAWRAPRTFGYGAEAIGKWKKYYSYYSFILCFLFFSSDGAQIIYRPPRWLSYWFWQRRTPVLSAQITSSDSIC